MILSCFKNTHRIKTIYNIWLKYSEIPYKIIIADPNINTDYIEYDNYIIVKTQDNYYSLSEKVKKGIYAINKLYNPDCILKCDDDVVVLLSKLKELLKYKQGHYVGEVVNFNNLQIDNKIIDLDYCGGPLYFIDKLAIELLINDNTIYNSNEDLNLSYTLYKKKIIPKKVNMYIDMVYGKKLVLDNKNKKNKHVDIDWFNNIWLPNINKIIGKHYQNEITNITKNIYCELCGGIGNRLFQLAFIINFSICYPSFKCFVYDLEKINHNVNNLEWCEKVIKKCNIEFIYSIPDDYIEISESHSNIYNPSFIENIFNYYDNKNIKISRYFQTEKYFNENESKIKEIFNILFNKKSEMIKKYNNIDFDNSYFLHIRGGDYCNNKFHEINIKTYIKKCVTKISKKNSNKDFKYLVFTNDNNYSKPILDY